MTTASDGVAVIATQLAQTDRRALSEAWYSALHLATAGAPQPHAAAKPPTATAASPERTPRPNAPHQQPSSPLPAHPERSRGTTATARTEPPDRRRPVSATTRRIERAVARLTARRPVPAAHTVDVAGGRVRLLVHGDARATRIVALCSPPLREQVERALASARFSLAGAGMVVVA